MTPQLWDTIFWTLLILWFGGGLLILYLAAKDWSE